MQVTNSAAFPVIAFTWHTQVGYGEDVLIQPGQSVDISGPFVGELEGRDCFIAAFGSIICHEEADEENRFFIASDCQINLQSGNIGVTVRHYSENRKIEWPG